MTAQRRTKRILDTCIAGAALLLLSPVIGLVALAVRLRLGSPVLFAQMRPGLQERPFQMLKFRTMTDARDLRGTLLPDSERLPSFGRWLRSTSLDELPELVNVVRGEMSLVGPRPLLMEYVPLYSPEQRRRHSVPPGITGWAQINGRNATSWDERFALDLWYVDHWSLLLDLKIAVRTVKAVFMRRGVAQEGHVTMPRFSGSAEARPLRGSSAGDSPQWGNPCLRATL
jgi:sugar transferase EpsL